MLFMIDIVFQTYIQNLLKGAVCPLASDEDLLNQYVETGQAITPNTSLLLQYRKCHIIYKSSRKGFEYD